MSAAQQEQYLSSWDRYSYGAHAQAPMHAPHAHQPPPPQQPPQASHAHAHAHPPPDAAYQQGPPGNAAWQHAPTHGQPPNVAYGTHAPAQQSYTGYQYGQVNEYPPSWQQHDPATQYAHAPPSAHTQPHSAGTPPPAHAHAAAQSVGASAAVAAAIAAASAPGKKKPSIPAWMREALLKRQQEKAEAAAKEAAQQAADAVKDVGQADADGAEARATAGSRYAATLDQQQ